MAPRRGCRARNVCRTDPCQTAAKTRWAKTWSSMPDHRCHCPHAYTRGTSLLPTALSRTRCSETCRNGMRARALRCPGHRNQYRAGLLLASMWKQASGNASMALWRASAHSFKSRLQRCRWTWLKQLGLASQHPAEATAREYRHVLPYFRTSRACAWSVHETTPMVQGLGWRGGW